MAAATPGLVKPEWFRRLIGGADFELPLAMASLHLQGAPLRGRLATLRRVVAQWAWTPIVRRVLVWLGAFLALVHVGSGAAARLLSAPRARLAEGAPLIPDPGGERLLGLLAATMSPAASPPTSSVACNRRDGGTDRAAITDDGKVILNVASVKDLVQLPGIGSKRALAIVELRQRLGGRFRRVRDLLRIRGIGYRSLKRIEPLVVLDPPKKESE